MSVTIKLIKTENDYKNALNLIRQLMSGDPDANSPEGEQLELLATLVQSYEENIFGESIPDPIDALLFRMEQQGLTAEDLVPYIGSRSKVSEILSRKRPLSVSMMRALQSGLDIPAKVLLNQQSTLEPETALSNLPIKEMIKRGYIKARENITQELNEFFNVFDGASDVMALLSKTSYIRSPRPMNKYSLSAWIAQILNKAKKVENVGVFVNGSINPDFLKKIADLSDEESGIYKAIDLLRVNGVVVVIEPNLPKTYLDGAAIMLKGSQPVIGITVRYDRLDNFWFTLLHELAHISLHLGKGINIFYDDILFEDTTDSREKEADELAIKSMIPLDQWIDSPASILPSADSAKLLAKELSIHPALVAGRMRYSKKQYYFLNSLIGKGEVRILFPEVKW